jgi:hypothetical protein
MRKDDIKYINNERTLIFELIIQYLIKLLLMHFMNHLCFIVENSLTMLQKGSNNMSLIDYVKSSIETMMRNL